MKRFCCTVISLFVLFSVTGISYAKAEKDKPRVVATTTLIGSILEEVGANKIDFVTLIPSGMCPGHFDISPGDLKSLEEGVLFLKQGFEGEKIFEDLSRRTRKGDIKRINVAIEGNWMVPSIYIKAVDKITVILGENFPEFRDYFKEEAALYKEEILSVTQRMSKLIRKKTANKQIACSVLQKPFLEWCGFDVVVQYPRAENISLEKYRAMIDIVKKKDIVFVVDNLQSGPKVGVPLAEELNIPHLVLSNFPYKKDGRLSYLGTLKDNLDKLVESLQ